MSDPEAVGSPEAPLTVDTRLRHDVVSFYHAVYKASEGANAGVYWTGNVAGCVPGTTSDEFKRHVRRRVNWFRAMAGMPADIVFDPAFNQAAQAAALIMAQVRNASHDPAKFFGTGGCWTEAGQTGATNGNLAVGIFGVDAVDGYVNDKGVLTVGHRTWILDARASRMGTGDIASVDPTLHPPSNCLYVVDNQGRRAPLGGMHSWPPAGYVPAPTVYDLWSLHVDVAYATGLHFGAAEVSMAIEATGQTVPVTTVHRSTEGQLVVSPYLVWQPDWKDWGGRPPLETPIRVTITGIAPGSNDRPSTHSYTVTVIDPDKVTHPQTITGPPVAPLSGAAFCFSGLADVPADAYELGAWRVVNGNAVEGAEDATATRVVDLTKGGRQLRRALPASPAPPAGSGAKCFHLLIADFDHEVQAFELDLGYLAGSQSQLRFHRRLGWMKKEATLRVLVSTDQGKSWSPLWEKAGTDARESAWTQVTLDLAPFADSIVRVKFSLTQSEGGIYTGTTADYGALIDNITLTGGDTLDGGKISLIDATARSFVFEPARAGIPLAVGQKWRLQIRPILGGHTFPFSTPATITLIPAVAGFDHWTSVQLPCEGGSKFEDDPHGTGVPNGVRYAFGLDRTRPGAQPPAPVFLDGAWVLEFDPSSLPAPAAGVHYGAEVSTDGKNWSPLANTSTTTALRFPLPSGPSQLVRWKVSRQPTVGAAQSP